MGRLDLVENECVQIGKYQLDSLFSNAFCSKVSPETRSVMRDSILAPVGN